MKERSALAGSLIAGLLASICCIGPLVLGAVGLGALGFAAALAPLRPWFLAMTGVLIAVGFFLAYGPPRAEACLSDGKCAKPVDRRGQRIALWVVTVLAMALATYPRWAARPAAAREPAGLARGASSLVVLDVEGMTCADCEAEIEQALGKLPGVVSARVSYERKRAEVRVASIPPEREALFAAVAKAGYRASLKGGR